MFVPESKSRISSSSCKPGRNHDSVTTEACRSNSLKVSINEPIFGCNDLALVDTKLNEVFLCVLFDSGLVDITLLNKLLLVSWFSIVDFCNMHAGSSVSTVDCWLFEIATKSQVASYGCLFLGVM